MNKQMWILNSNDETKAEIESIVNELDGLVDRIKALSAAQSEGMAFMTVTMVMSVIPSNEQRKIAFEAFRDWFDDDDFDLRIDDYVMTRLNMVRTQYLSEQEAAHFFLNRGYQQQEQEEVETKQITDLPLNREQRRALAKKHHSN